MKIFASSQTDLADTFLHAGYISAQPLGLDLPDQLASLPLVGWLAEPGGILGLTLAAVAVGALSIGVFWIGRSYPSGGRWWSANVWPILVRPVRRRLGPPDS
jgi:hypothetical protein